MTIDTGSRPQPGASRAGHDEWLIDAATEQTFPASDPSSAVQPGSIVGVRYGSVRQSRRRPTTRRGTHPLWWLAAACAVGLVIADGVRRCRARGRARAGERGDVRAPARAV
jgi:hypothetical protein